MDNTLKFGKTVLVQFIEIVRDALVTGSDISQKLRELELQLSDTEPGIIEIKAK